MLKMYPISQLRHTIALHAASFKRMMQYFKLNIIQNHIQGIYLQLRCCGTLKVYKVKTLVLQCVSVVVNILQKELNMTHYRGI